MLKKIYCFLSGTNRKRTLSVLSILLAALIVSGIVLHSENFGPALDKGHLISKLPYDSDSPNLSSVSTRLSKWINSMAIIKDHPLLGVGLGSFHAAYPYYHKSIIDDFTYSRRFWFGGLHNDPLEYLVELGLTGFVLILFVSIFFYIF